MRTYLDEYLAMTPKEKREVTHVILDMFRAAHERKLDRECQQDHEEDREGGWR